jgi:hypothetical protein
MLSSPSTAYKVTLAWNSDDVRYLSPQLGPDEADAFLESVEEVFCHMINSYSYDVLNDLLAQARHKTDPRYPG